MDLLGHGKVIFALCLCQVTAFPPHLKPFTHYLQDQAAQQMQEADPMDPMGTDWMYRDAPADNYNFEMDTLANALSEGIKLSEENRVAVDLIASYLDQLEQDRQQLQESKLSSFNDNQPEAWPFLSGPRSDESQWLDFAKRSLFVSKKDRESLEHQADPSLTVQHLSKEPQISFRKAVDKATTMTTTEKPAFNRGMKEVAMLWPSTGPKSPLAVLAEQQQLKNWAHSLKSNNNLPSY